MINDLYEGMPVKWADEFTTNRIVPGKRRGVIKEIAEHAPTGTPAVLIKFSDGSTMGMFAIQCRLQMSKDD